ncbi:hypothetical protein M0R45_013061 [Rubus argutus]|uniref:Receptor-like serine/threonine-protein kinase n=1 Tax=Rubus argutus TaxID=59490 RepID=A0AAW1XJI3_RUBAR
MDISSKNPGSVIRFLSFFVIISCFLALFCSASSSITQGQTVKDSETLISAGQIFELGFFSPSNSSSRYLGIWYYNISDLAIVWVANRDKPISGKAGILTIGSDGNLVILDGNSSEIWSSNASSTSKNSTAVLEDSGNLVLSSNKSTRAQYWQSFDNPTDTFMPGMRVKVNAAEGENRPFRSWKSASDPAPGEYFSGIDPRGAVQLVIWNGSERIWRSGHWNKLIFIGLPNMPTSYMGGFSLTDHPDEDGNYYFSYTPWSLPDKVRFQIRWDGYEEQKLLQDKANQWVVLQSQPNKSSECEFYNKCGNFGVCSASDAACKCMQGFEQRSLGNWSDGCYRKTPLKCERNSTNDEDGEDGFVEVKCTKLPDFADLVVVTSPQVTCEQSCLNNCSCTAYADVSGLGCMIWTSELVDVQQFSKGGNALHIRLAHSDLGGGKKLSTLVITLISVAGAIFLAIFIFLVWRFKAKLKVLPTTTSLSWLRSSDTPILDASRMSKEFSTEISGSYDHFVEGNQVNGPDLPSFNFNSVSAATNNFSEENKLGNGGFGTVYKGILPGLEEIAVKRLSRKSCQGLEEFKNEINLIAKLQHRNLVRLLGCCIEGEEKMLLYEYMPNKSLDFFLFDATRQALLNWSKRFMIIEGIARGLLYLHRDSRLRIIHRDLKASNILLDEDMIPKISDFGMARIFGGNQNEANTMRVVGTYGYMSPEYAMEGLFSVKSDVYSFGVLLLEIVSGRRNISLRTSEHLSLIGYAWHLWNENKPEDLIDPSIAETCSQTELLRCIHVGLLCVQDSADWRPTMSAVVLMLESETANLPLPREPVFTSIKRYVDTSFSTEEEGQDLISVNNVTITVVDGR